MEFWKYIYDNLWKCCLSKIWFINIRNKKIYFPRVSSYFSYFNVRLRMCIKCKFLNEYFCRCQNFCKAVMHETPNVIIDDIFIKNLFISLWFINVWKEKQLQLRIFSAMEFPMHFWAYILYQFKIFFHPSYENISWKDLYLLETPSSFKLSIIMKFLILLFLINPSVKISLIYYKETIFFSSNAINFAFRNF